MRSRYVRAGAGFFARGGGYGGFLPAFRVGIALFCLLQCWYWADSRSAFFGEEGWIQWEISKAIVTTWSIHLSDFYRLVSVFSVDKPESVSLFFGLYALLAVFVLVGFLTRISAFLLWLGHVMILNTLSDFIYGVDVSLHIALFYLFLFPVNRYYSLDNSLFGKKPPQIRDKVYNRIFQFHLCAMYLSSGLEKAVRPDWWNGNAIWYTLNHPDFTTLRVADTLVTYPALLVGLGIATVLVEASYPVLMWVPRWRVWSLGAVVLMHVYIGVALGLGPFSLIMVLFSVTAWISDCIKDYAPPVGVAKPLVHHDLANKGR